MEHSIGKVQRAFSLWGQACRVLLKCPLLIFWQVIIAFLVLLLRRLVFHPLSILWLILPLYFFNDFLSHYTMRFMRDNSIRYKKSYEAVLIAPSPYLLLFIPLLYLFFYEPFYGQKLFFAAAGIGEDADLMNIYVAKILFVLLVLLLLFLFIVQHIALVIIEAGKISYKEATKRTFHLLRSNLVTIISLTCLLFLTWFLLSSLARAAIFILPSWLNLALAYYVITVSINLYCIALTILYYNTYVKHEHA